MKSTLGRRALICKELGFSLDFVEHGISYAKLQMMLLDMPRMVDNNKDKVEHITLTEDNAERVLQMMMVGGTVLEE